MGDVSNFDVTKAFAKERARRAALQERGKKTLAAVKKRGERALADAKKQAAKARESAKKRKPTPAKRSSVDSLYGLAFELGRQLGRR